MIHLFLVGNASQQDLEDTYAFTEPFRDVIPESDLSGMVISTELVPRTHFKWCYVRVSNQTNQHDDRVYVVIDFDYNLFPKVEGFVEHRVFPELTKTLDEMADGLCLGFLELKQNENHGLYIYRCDGKFITDATSELFRNQVIKPVEE